MTEFFIKNRKNLLNSIKYDNFLIVLFSGNSPIKNGDQNYPFSPNRNFFYLTGLDSENLIFFAYKNKDKVEEIVFIEKQDKIKEKWEGKILDKVAAKTISGIQNIKYKEEFENFFANITFKNNIEYIFLNIENRNLNNISLENIFANKIKSIYPNIKIKNIYNKIGNLRTLKTEFEISQIKKAIDITEKGIYSMMKNCSPNMYEYNLEAYFDFELKNNSVKEKAFETIVASGENATVLHYNKNNCKIKDNDLILVDLGATFNYYSCDISRTFPANKKFSERQKLFYNVVLEAQNLAISNIKPGVQISFLQEIVEEYYFKELSKLKLVNKKEEVKNYYYHNIGHFLGLEVHDVTPFNNTILEENNILTIEPGLYIREENIGIRIEDDILVTKDGFEILSKNIIKSIEDIENFMSN